MTAIKRGEPFKKLLKRASMDIYAFNTGVVRGTDQKASLIVDSGVDGHYGDCVGVGMRVGDSPFWTYTHVSPARARLLAMHLLRHADRLEKSDPGMECIDTFSGVTVRLQKGK